MARTWTSERNERLLLLVVDELKANFDCKALAKKWADRYGNEDEYKPTERALKKQISALRKKAGAGKGSNGGGSGRQAASAPRTPSIKSKKMPPVTPASSSKRKKGAVSDEDDDDSEPDMVNGRLSQDHGQRASLSRTKKGRISYQESDHDEGDESEGEVVKSESGIDNPFDVEFIFDGLADKKSF